MSRSTVRSEVVFKNLSAMNSLFSSPADALEDPVDCAQCGTDDAYEKFGTDYLCESCLTLVGNVLAAVHYGIEADEDGRISVIA